jgi:hypothetical protein
MNDIIFNTIYKRGYVSATCPPDVFAQIKAEVTEMRENAFAQAAPYNSLLVGSIQHEYLLERSCDALMAPVQAMADAYMAEFGADPVNFAMRDPFGGAPDVWVNFQQKGEDNPPHQHRGDLSFVLWVQVPFEIQAERARLPENSMATFAASFGMLIPDHYSRGGIATVSLPVDRTWEGRMILFSSDTFHYVTPFHTSDAYRISVAGNIRAT